MNASVTGSTVLFTGVAAGTVTVTVTATDTSNLTATQTFTLTVSAQNQAPTTIGTIPDQTVTVGGSATTVDVSSYFSDADNDTLTYTASSSDTAKATVAVSNATVSITAVAAGTATITVTATDPGSLTATQTFSVTVSQPNHPPVAVGTIPDQSLSVGGAAVSVDVSSYFNDPDGDALSYAFSSSDTNKLNASIAGSTILFTGVDTGTVTITVTATDTSDLFASQTFSVVIGSQNRPPVAVGTIPDQSLSVGGAAVSVDVSSYFNDPDGDALSYAFSSSDTNKLNASIAGSTILFTGVDTGTVTITVTATDTSDLFASQTFSVAIGSQNRPPVAVGTIPDQSLSVGGAAVSVDVSSYFNDPDGDALSYAFSSSDTNKLNASITGSTILFTGVDEGTITITVTATDTSDLSASQVFSVAVSSQKNGTPVTIGTIPDQTVNIGGAAVSVDVSSYFSDPDGDALSYAFEFSDSSKMNASVTGSTVLFTGVAAGTVTVTVTATDTGNLTATQTFTLTVNAQNQAPTTIGTIPDQTMTVGDSVTTVDVSSYFSDADNNTLTYTADSSDTAKATVSVSNATVTLTAVAAGTATITVTATDTSNLSVTQSFSVTVSESNNRAPVTTTTLPDQTITVGGAPATINVGNYFSDPDGDTLSYAYDASKSDIGVKMISTETGITITSSQTGIIRLTVTAKDPGGLSATQSCIITVGAASNRAPAAVGTIPAQTMTVGDSVTTVDVSNYFSDADNDTLTYTANSSDTAKATVSVSNATISITGVAAGTARITVTATDPDSLTATQSFTLTVTQPNRAPVKSSKSEIPKQSMDSASPVSVTAIDTYFSDPDGDTLTYTAASSNTTIATASVSSTTVTVSRVTAALSGEITITVTATDPGGLSATRTFTVTVEPLNANRAPTAVGTIPNQTMTVDATTPSLATVDVSRYFSDPDSDTLTYTASSSDTTTATVSVSRATISITAIAAGTATITVTATDPGSLSATQTFSVTASHPNRAPTAVGTIPNQTLTIGGASVTLNLSKYFSDPDSDTLVYTARISDEQPVLPESLVKMGVSNTLQTLSITARQAEGSGTITVKAADPDGINCNSSLHCDSRST